MPVSDTPGTVTGTVPVTRAATPAVVDDEHAAAVGDRHDRLAAGGDREGEVGQGHHDDRLATAVGRPLDGEVGAQGLPGDHEGGADDLDPQVRAGRQAEGGDVGGVDRHRDGAAGDAGDRRGRRWRRSGPARPRAPRTRAPFTPVSRTTTVAPVLSSMVPPRDRSPG